MSLCSRYLISRPSLKFSNSMHKSYPSWLSSFCHGIHNRNHLTHPERIPVHRNQHMHYLPKATSRSTQRFCHQRPPYSLDERSSNSSSSRLSLFNWQYIACLGVLALSHWQNSALIAQENSKARIIEGFRCVIYRTLTPSPGQRQERKVLATSVKVMVS